MDFASIFSDANNLWSHIILWAIGGLAICSTIGVVGAFYSMARSGYRKD